MGKKLRDDEISFCGCMGLGCVTSALVGVALAVVVFGSLRTFVFSRAPRPVASALQFGQPAPENAGGARTVLGILLGIGLGWLVGWGIFWPLLLIAIGLLVLWRAFIRR